MKKFIIYLSLIALSCNGNKEVAFKRSPPDTIMTLLVYKNNGIKWDLGYRLRKDSFMFVGIDSLTQKKGWARYSEYFVPLIDSLRDKDGKVLIDSVSQKPKVQLRYYPCPINLILADLNKNLDSLSRANPPK